MLPTPLLLRKNLEQVIAAKAAQGHLVAGLQTELARLPDRYDDLYAFGERMTAC